MAGLLISICGIAYYNYLKYRESKEAGTGYAPANTEDDLEDSYAEGDGGREQVGMRRIGGVTAEHRGSNSVASTAL